ncbi:MAG: AAA family ATPase [candidate division WOR-3 bacterium]|nr:AAA family ATPase [candidate division WOR-3 bacterium]
MKNNQFEVPIEKLRLVCDPNKFPFETTDEVGICNDIIGQDRAVKALKLGIEIPSAGYHIFVTGLVGTGRTTAVKYLLDTAEKSKKIPDDILYVNNFADPDNPKLIRLPAGMGDKFAYAMEELIENLKKNIPMVLESDTYQLRRNKLIEHFKAKSSTLALEFEKKLQAENFGIVQLLPIAQPELVYIYENQQLNFEGVANLYAEQKITREQFQEIQKKFDKFSQELNEIFQKIKAIEKETRASLSKLEQDTIKPVVLEQIEEIKSEFNFEPVHHYLDEVTKAILSNIERFIPQEKKSHSPVIDQFLEFKVNVLVDNSHLEGAPVIFETTPTYKNIFGTIERVWDRSGQWRTDFTKIKAGSLLKADGGFLILNALDAILEPGVWPTLKRTLRNRILEITSFDPYTMFAISGLKPEPIPIDVKVIMIGDARIYNILYNYDEDFKKIFKVRADFDWVMPLSDETIRQYAQVIKGICHKENLLAFDKTAVAAIVEYGVRLAGRKNYLSTQFNLITDVLKEANYWAQKEKAKVISKRHIEKAIEERIERVKLIEDKIQKMIEEGTIFIDTEGKVVGQVNGLSIYDVGEYSFGRPSRITAKIGVGASGVINIEREAELSGPIHSKGVLILSGYLRDKYAQDKPLALSASLCFEQSYSGVEGDSASSAELYALLSSLSGIPIRQDLAVTGSVNQKGEVQPIGGVNQKIEGFFAVCKAKGLTGTQGVIIPQANIDDLMLRNEVLEAVRQGKFHIYAIKTIDEGIELLTGVKAGTKDENGNYPQGTINYLVNERLKQLAQYWQEYQGLSTGKSNL